jgi:hypothetical protein
VHVVEIVKIDDKELHVPDDVLEQASAARYQTYLKIKITFSERIEKNYK